MTQHQYTLHKQLNEELKRMLVGAKKRSRVTYSKHSLWLWFNFNGEFKGYSKDVQEQMKLERELKEKIKTEDLRNSIKDGTYGLNSKDKGGVYLLSCGDYYKIGFSTDVNKRLAAIRCSNPLEVELLVKYSCHTGKYRQLEGKLHEKFKESRHLLEWFKKDFTKEDFIEACKEFCKDKYY